MAYYDPWDPLSMGPTSARDHMRHQEMVERMYQEMRYQLTDDISREVERKMNMPSGRRKNSDYEYSMYNVNNDTVMVVGMDNQCDEQAPTCAPKEKEKKEAKVEDKKLKDLISYYYSRNR